MIIEDRDFLNIKEQDYLITTILGFDFPFYLSSSQVDGDDAPFFSHIVLQRPEDRRPDVHYNSSTGEFFEGILKKFCKKHDIEFNEMLRCCINISFPLSKKISEKHVDHEYDHKQLILYLNDCDGDTCIEDGNEIKHIKPQKFKGVCFDAVPHYAEYPTSGYRAVVVFTFC